MPSFRRAGPAFYHGPPYGADPLARCPQCLDGARACPPEDCGGTGGYENLIEVLRDPEHPEYEDLLRWVSGYFDPEAFDLDAINRRLKRLRSLA